MDSSDEATLLQLFVWGLQRDITEKMSLAHPTSLANATAAAEEIELALHFSRRSIAHVQRTSGQKTASYNTRNKGVRSKGRWYRSRGGNRGGTQYFAGNRGGGQQTQPKNVMSLGIPLHVIDVDDRDILLPTVHKNQIIKVETRVDATAAVDVEMDAEVEEPDLQ